MWIKNTDKNYLNLDLEKEIQWEGEGEEAWVTTATLHSHSSIFLVLSSALDCPLNLSVWLQFLPAVGKEKHLSPEYVYPENEPRRENAVALRQQAAQASREVQRIAESVFHLDALYLCDWQAGGWDHCHHSFLVKYW